MTVIEFHTQLQVTLDNFFRAKDRLNQLHNSLKMMALQPQQPPRDITDPLIKHTVEHWLIIMDSIASAYLVLESNELDISFITFDKYFNYELNNAIDYLKENIPEVFKDVIDNTIEFLTNTNRLDNINTIIKRKETQDGNS